MKFSIYLDQLTLGFWKDKIDFLDCGILAFIADLNPQDKEIKNCMWRGYFLITRKWLLDQLPMLQIGEQAIYKRLKKLRGLGILSCIHKTIDGNKTLAYFKMSDLYWKIRAKRNKRAGEAAENIKAIISEDNDDIKSHSISVSEPSSPGTSNESIKDSFTTLYPAETGKASADTVVEEEEKKEVSKEEFDLQWETQRLAITGEKRKTAVEIKDELEKIPDITDRSRLRMSYREQGIAI